MRDETDGSNSDGGEARSDVVTPERAEQAAARGAEQPTGQAAAASGSARSGASKTRLLLFSLVATLLFFGVCEGVSRLVYPHNCSSVARLERYIQAGGRSPGGAPSGSHQRSIPMPFEPYLMWHLIPSYNGLNLGVKVHHNDQGLRSPDRPMQKPANTSRVLLLGDSTLYGHGVEEPQTLRSRLELALQEAVSRDVPGRRVEVISAGVPGYSSLQSLNQLRRIGLNFGPDVVVIANLWSDAMLDRFEDEEVMYGSGWKATWARVGQGLDEWLAPKSTFYCVMKDKVIRIPQKTCPGSPPLCVAPKADRVERFNFVNQPGAQTVALKPRVSLAQYRKNLLELASLVQDAGAAVAFMVLGNIRDVGGRDDQHPLPAEYEPYRELMRTLAKQESAALIEVPTAMQRSEQPNAQALFMDQVHPTALGHAVMSAALSQGLLEHAGTRAKLEGR